MNPLVSIVVPIYNVEKYLRKCLDSIVNQTYTNLEIILVNDGSPDNSKEICEEYQLLDSRIIIINQVNGGLSNARNSGLLRASGELICFIDSDDFVELNFIQSIARVMVNEEIDVCIWGYNLDFYNNKDELIATSKILPNINGDSSLKAFELESIEEYFVGILGYAWNKMYKTEFLKLNNLSFENGLSLIEDVVFNGNVFTLTTKVYFVNEAFSHYIQRSRETLGTRYYNDYFQKKLRAYNLQINILKVFNFQTDQISFYFKNSCFSGLKATMRALSKASNLNFIHKNKHTKSLLEDENVVSFLACYKADNFINMILYILMKYKYHKILLLLFLIKYKRLYFKKK